SATAICAGQTTILSASGALSYSWSTSATTNAITVSPGLTSSYTVTGNNSGCSSSQTFTVVVNQPPVISGGSFNTATCGNLNGGVDSLTITPAGAYTYTWTDQASGAVVGDSLQLSGVGAGNYSLTVTDANGCTATGGLPIYTVPSISSPTLDITPAFTHGTSPVSVTFAANASADVTTYNWSIGDGTTSNLPGPSNTYTAAGTYPVILTADNGTCAARDTAIVVVDAAVSILIPNIYSPNGDGINDEFFVTCVGIKDLHCDIFNRWGQLIYQMFAVDDKWDGVMINGNDATDGTYFYILDATGYDGKKYKAHGSLTLVR
ncbi:MAG: T9SS type B sorting domain-containing protein, partial [Bacteroidia bacterium]